MSEPEKPFRMRPVIILPRKAMTKADIKQLRDNGICVVEAEIPSDVRFIEPPPEGYSTQEQAAIKLCRFLLSKDNVAACRDKDNIAACYAHFVIQGTPLQQLRPEQVKKAKA